MKPCRTIFQLPRLVDDGGLDLGDYSEGIVKLLDSVPILKVKP